MLPDCSLAVVTLEGHTLSLLATLPELAAGWQAGGLSALAGTAARHAALRAWPGSWQGWPPDPGFHRDGNEGEGLNRT